MKNFITLFSLFLAFSCTSDDDGEPAETASTIEGSWYLTYLTDVQSTRLNPGSVCNGEMDLALEITGEPDHWSVTGNTPCNGYNFIISEIGESTLHITAFGITLTECQPSMYFPECVLDGNEFENLMVHIFTDRWAAGESNSILHAIERTHAADTLRISNNFRETAVFYRNFN